jgi:hypothetical protein
MRTFLLVIAVLTTIATNALAAWQQVAETDVAVSYVDPGTIVRTGSSVKVMSLTDYGQTQTWEDYTFLSSLTQWEYDCNEPRGRVLVENGYTGHKATGAASYNLQGPRPWQLIKPGTVGDSRRNVVCGR